MNNCGPITEIVLDEIGLEGLDGITIESLWLRLSIRLNLPFPLNPNFCVQIWNYLQKSHFILFYELQEPRPLIRVFNRAECFQSDKTEYKDTTYAFNPITNEYGIMGSCQDYVTRKCIEPERINGSSIKEIRELYGNRFIMVGTQLLREKSIIPDNAVLLNEITPFLYSIVERIGRSRLNGEKSSGKNSLSELFESGKIHYIRNRLLKHKLIMKQPFYEKHGDTSSSGFLLHLPRFYREFKNKQMTLTEHIIGYLKNQPMYLAEYANVRESIKEVSLQDYLKKLYKQPAFQKFVETDVKIPYRLIHPNASPSECKKKKKNEERTLRVLKLRDPNIDIFNLWPQNIENDEEEDAFLDVSKQLLDVPLLKQSLNAIKVTRSKGLTMVELGRQLGLSKLNARSIIRNLERLKQITSYTVDEGRQRVAKYISARYKESTKKKLQEAVSEIDSDTSVRTDNKLENTLGIKQEPEVVETVAQLPPVGETQIPESDYPEPQQIDDPRMSEILCTVQQIQTPVSVPANRIINKPNFTLRIAKRLGIIVRAVNQDKVIKDVYTLKKKVLDEEKKLGYKDEICKKSLLRLLGRLSIDKRIKLFLVKMTMDQRTKEFMVMTDMSFEPDTCPTFSMVLSAAKSRLLITIANEESKKNKMEKKQVDKQPPMTVKEKIKKASAKEQIQQNPLDDQIQYDGGVNYNYIPKFIRMRTLHEFLFYLTYEQNDIAEPIDQDLAKKHWKQLEPLTEFEEHLPPIWSLEFGWKMFVQPLIPYAELSKGWTLMTDVVYRLPLSLFVKIVKCFDVKGLDELLADPVKRHYLIKDIPAEIQCHLIKNKKHIYTIDESMRRLCCIGLVQIGTQWQKEKEALFIYVNQNGKIVDTRISLPGYDQISEEEEYPIVKYHFNSMENISKYWHDLSRICLETPLGQRFKGNERKEQINYWLNKPDLVKRMESKSKEYILDSDTGEIPGDGLGAGGLDSSFYAHILRNWSIINKTRKSSRKPVAPSTSSISLKLKGVPLKSVNRDTSKTKKTAKIIPIRRVQQRIIKGKKMVTKKLKQKSAYTSPIDRKALSQMTRLRTDWNPKEDNIILFCKVAQMYLSGDSRKLFLSNCIVRDILHWHLGSLSKTSRACQRRIVYVMKNPITANSVYTCLQDVQNNPEITSKFPADLYEQIGKHFENEDMQNYAMKIVFADFVYFLLNHYISLNSSTVESRETILPDTYEEFHNMYEIKNEELSNYKLKYKCAEMKSDICINTLHTLIHSSVCCAKDKTSWSTQLYDIYKDYPEVELYDAMKKIRTDQLISANKSMNSIKQKSMLPLSSHPFHLSVTYFNQLLTKISTDVYTELTKLFTELQLAPAVDVKLSQINSGHCFAISQFLIDQNVNIKIELPSKILALDKTINEDDNLLERNRTRFRELFEIVPHLADAASSLLDDRDGVVAEETTSKNWLMEKKRKKVAINDSHTKIEYQITTTERIMKLDDNLYHLFCLLAKMGQEIKLEDLKLSSDKFCPLDCILSKNEPIIKIIDLIKANENVIRRLDTENQVNNLDETCIVNETNIILIFSILINRIFSNGDDDDVFDLEDISDHGVIQIALDVLDDDDDALDSPLLENTTKFDFDLMDPDTTTDKLRQCIQENTTDIVPEKIHNLFNVNACKILLNYHNTDGNDHLSLIKLAENVKSEVLKKASNDVRWQKKLIPIHEDAHIALEDLLPMDEFDMALEIYNFIKLKKEPGAKSKELIAKFRNKKLILKIINLLCDKQFILRTGIVDFVYVHWSNVTPWLISSYNIKRLQKEAIPTNKYQLLDPTALGKRKQSDEQNSNEEPTNKIRKLNDEENETIDLVESPEKGSSASAQLPRRLEKMVIQADNVQQLIVEDSSVNTKFYILMNPWTRVNGSLNRRVLDKWLGVILLYCISNPCTTLLNICSRFSLIQPLYLRLLFEYLELLGCIEMYILENQVPSFWSTYKQPKKEKACELDSIEDILIEVQTDALVKMAQFIGEKKYNVDFI